MTDPNACDVWIGGYDTGKFARNNRWTHSLVQGNESSIHEPEAVS
jgi:hypothetical protein